MQRITKPQQYRQPRIFSPSQAALYALRREEKKEPDGGISSNHEQQQPECLDKAQVFDVTERAGGLEDERPHGHRDQKSQRKCQEPNKWRGFHKKDLKTPRQAQRARNVNQRLANSAPGSFPLPYAMSHHIPAEDRNRPQCRRPPEIAPNPGRW